MNSTISHSKNKIEQKSAAPRAWFRVKTRLGRDLSGRAERVLKNCVRGSFLNGPRTRLECPRIDERLDCPPEAVRSTRAITHVISLQFWR